MNKYEQVADQQPIWWAVGSREAGGPSSSPCTTARLLDTQLISQSLKEALAAQPWLFLSNHLIQRGNPAAPQRTEELGGSAVHGNLDLALAASRLECLADEHQALLVGLQSEMQAVVVVRRAAAFPKTPWPKTPWAADQTGPRTWMPGAKPPSSPTLTESTPYFFFTMALRWWYTSLPSCTRATPHTA